MTVLTKKKHYFTTHKFVKSFLMHPIILPQKTQEREKIKVAKRLKNKCRLLSIKSNNQKLR